MQRQRGADIVHEQGRAGMLSTAKLSEISATAPLSVTHCCDSHRGRRADGAGHQALAVGCLFISSSISAKPVRNSTKSPGCDDDVVRAHDLHQFVVGDDVAGAAEMRSRSISTPRPCMQDTAMFSTPMPAHCGSSHGVMLPCAS